MSGSPYAGRPPRWRDRIAARSESRSRTCGLGCCALSRQSGERLSLRREAAEVERPDSSEVGESIENELMLTAASIDGSSTRLSYYVIGV